jgi:hypothetical protein
MSVLRIGLAAVAAFVAYMVVGGLAFGLIPSLRTEFLKYPAVYRSAEGQKSHIGGGPEEPYGGWHAGYAALNGGTDGGVRDDVPAGL